MNPAINSLPLRLSFTTVVAAARCGMLIEQVPSVAGREGLQLGAQPRPPAVGCAAR